MYVITDINGSRRGYGKGTRDFSMKEFLQHCLKNLFLAACQDELLDKSGFSW